MEGDLVWEINAAIPRESVLLDDIFQTQRSGSFFIDSEYIAREKKSDKKDFFVQC
jgi:hypothetical protein